MGVFDLRCGVSGLSTSGPPEDEHFDCSMVLLEPRDGVFLPVLFPITGAYDRYGRIELTDWRGSDPAEREHAAWLGAILERLWDESTFASAWPAGMEHVPDLGGAAARFFAHAADSVFNRFALTLAGRRVVPCIYRDDVAREIAARDDGGARDGRLVDAWMRRNEELGISASAKDAPEGARIVAERFRRVLRHVEARGGLRPILSGGEQHDRADRDRFVNEAWNAGDPIVRSMIERWLRAEEDAAAVERELARKFHETDAERAYASRVVDVDTVRAVLGRSVGAAEAAHIVAAIERAEEGARARVLAILSAPRAAHPAALAELDGRARVTGERVQITSDMMPDVVVEVARERRALRVADGAHVRAGEPLTEGEVDLHDVVRVLGPRAACDRLAAELRQLLPLDDAQLEKLLAPMFSHLAIEGANLRVSGEQWQQWAEAGELASRRLVASQQLSSYAAVAAHRDPTLEDVLAAIARRAALAERASRLAHA